MGRHRKMGLDIAPLDPYLFESAKIRRLVSSGNPEAVLVFVYSFCKISKEGYFIDIDDDYIFLVSDFTGIPTEEVKIGLDKCVEVGLFDATLYENGILTSRDIQIRYSIECKKLNRISSIIVYNLLDKESKSEKNIISSKKSEEMIRNENKSDEIISSNFLEEIGGNDRKSEEMIGNRRKSSKINESAKTDNNQEDTQENQRAKSQENIDSATDIAKKNIANSSQNHVEEDLLPSFPPHTPPILSIQDRDSLDYNILDNIERKENKKEKREQNSEEIAEVLPAVPIMTKTPSLEERKKQFGKDLVPYIEKYGKEMIRDFFDYWTEHNEGGKKMRWEIAKTKSGTFNIAGRLATWNRRSNEGTFSGKRRKGCLPSELIRELYIPPKEGSSLDLSFDVDFDKLLK